MKLSRRLKGWASGAILTLASPLTMALSVTDVTLDGMIADAAATITTSGPGNPNPSEADINAVWGPPNFSQILHATPGTTDTGSYGGIDFSITSITPGTGGTFVLSWVASPADLLPTAMDLVFTLKGGSGEYNAYLFDDFVLTDESGSGAGTGDANGAYLITFTNNGGNNPDLSNLRVFIRDGDDTVCCGPPTNVPLPGTVFLLGLGLLGVRLARRS